MAEIIVSDCEGPFHLVVDGSIDDMEEQTNECMLGINLFYIIIKR
jgi:hypothetical protein